MQFAHEDGAVERRPEVAVGTGATVVMPGEPLPPMQPGARSGGGGEAGSTGSGGSDLTMIGGATEEISGETKDRKLPIIGPFTTLIGYPFWIFGKTIGEKADEEVARRNAGGGPGSRAPSPVRDDSERQRLASENQRLLEELRNQKKAPEPSPPLPAVSSGGGVASELAALRERLGTAPPLPGSPPQMGAQRPLEVLDRDANGRPDAWVYGSGTRRDSEALDEDGDGRVDRLRHYDPDGQLARVEEDHDGDGRLEATTLYEAGEPARRRADTDGDGQPDSWSFFTGGQLVRSDLDRDGDGFRDVSLHYAAGSLVREEEDKNADGRPDLVVLYREGQISERDEDLDFDGTPDVRSFYEHGRLVRREVRSPELLEGSDGSSGH